MEPQIAISIVTYRTRIEPLNACLESVLMVRLPFVCFIVDNGADADVRQCVQRFSARLTSSSRLEYIAQPNIGYGRAHNIAMTRSLAAASCRYHIAINPDIAFVPGTIERLVSFMDEQSNAGAVMPRIRYPDGSHQHLCKLLPSPEHLFARRFFPALAAGFDAVYTLRDADYGSVFECPSLSGCFMMLRTDALRQTGLFDERFFLYFEDVDLIRRMGQRFVTLYCPWAEVTHGYQKGSYSNAKLLWYHICSAVRYFNKWGWLFDRERTQMNKRALDRLPRLRKTPAQDLANI